MADRAIRGFTRNTMLLIFVTLFAFSTALNNTYSFEGFLDPAIKEEIVEVTTEESVGKSSSNPYAKYIFGLPPIPIDPAIPGVESDDDFETLAPFTPDQVYNKYWFISGFDKENRPILFKKVPRIHEAMLKKLSSNSTSFLKLLDKLKRYRFYISLKATKIRSTKEKPVTQYVSVLDYTNSNSYTAAFTNATIIRRIVHTIAGERQFFEKYQKEEIVLNIGVVAELVIRLFTRIGIRRRTQAYGTNKPTWLQALRRQFPRDQLPEEYGGLKGHVPIKLYPD